MTIYALVAPDNSVLRVEGNIDPTVKTKPGYRWLPYLKVMPAYNPETQVREGPARVVAADSVTDTWTVRAKTAGELDADKGAIISTIDKLQFLIAFDMENRVRVLEGKAQVTAAQYRAALKARL